MEMHLKISIHRLQNGGHFVQGEMINKKYNNRIFLWNLIYTWLISSHKFHKHVNQSKYNHNEIESVTQQVVDNSVSELAFNLCL